jgi:hypothetical protein
MSALPIRTSTPLPWPKFSGAAQRGDRQVAADPVTDRREQAGGEEIPEAAPRRRDLPAVRGGVGCRWGCQSHLLFHPSPRCVELYSEICKCHRIPRKWWRRLALCWRSAKACSRPLKFGVAAASCSDSTYPLKRDGRVSQPAPACLRQPQNDPAVTLAMVFQSRQLGDKVSIEPNADRPPPGAPPLFPAASSLGPGTRPG